MELRRLGCVEVGSARLGLGSISAAEAERFRDGERKEFGESEDLRFVGEGYEVIGGRRLSSMREDSGCSC